MVSMLTPELLAQIAEWRAKEAAGTLTHEEMREAIKIMRQGRVAAQTAAAKSGAKGPKKSGDELLSELGI